MSGLPDDEQVSSGDGSDDGESTDGGSNGPAYRWGGGRGATRRGVLGSLAGAIATMGLSGHTTALDSEPGATTVPGTGEDPPWPESLRDHWSREARAGPASQHCLPETLAEDWQSRALEQGVERLLVRTEDDRPVYV